MNDCLKTIYSQDMLDECLMKIYEIYLGFRRRHDFLICSDFFLLVVSITFVMVYMKITNYALTCNAVYENETLCGLVAKYLT